MLDVLTDRKAITQCQMDLEKAVKRSATRCGRHTIGFPSGSMDADVYFLADLDFWTAFETTHNRYWNACGLGDPFAKQAPAPMFEINIPYEGIDRKTAGAFARDEVGEHYLVHSGRVGGGKKGVSLTNFHAYYPAHVAVECGGRSRSMYVISDLKSPALPRRVAEITRVSAAFRADVRAGKPSATQARANGKHDEYRDEFEGQKEYTTKERIVARVRHGKVVRTLRELLGSYKLVISNDVSRDLYIAGPSGSMKALFEVKTSTDTTAIYQALGQLLYHGGEPRANMLVAVLPRDVPHSVTERLERLGIESLRYAWTDDEVPAFEGVEVIAERIRGRR